MMNRTTLSAAGCVATLIACVGCSTSSQHAMHTTEDHNPKYINTRYNDDEGTISRKHETMRANEYSNDNTNTTSTMNTNTMNTSTAQPVATNSLGEWPPNAQAGECYGKAFVPPQVRTVQEQVLVHEASERLEVVPAQYQWVEERVMVKDASVQLVEVPAEYRTEQMTVELTPASQGWKMDSSGRCVTPDGRPVKDVFCLVNQPAVTKTVSQQKLAKASYTRETEVPAVYETVKRQRLSSPATCKRIAIPAEFQTVDRSVVTAPGRWEWQRVICDPTENPVTLNRVKEALLAAGYTPSATDGQMSEQDWDSIKAFQIQNGLAVGGLTYQTLAKMNINVD